MRLQGLKSAFVIFTVFVLLSCTNEIEQLRARAEKQHASKEHAQAVQILHEGLTKIRQENGGKPVERAAELENQKKIYAEAELQKHLATKDFQKASAWIKSYETLTSDTALEFRKMYLGAVKASLTEKQNTKQRRSIILQALDLEPENPDILQAHVQINIDEQEWENASVALEAYRKAVVAPPGTPPFLPKHETQAYKFTDIIRGELLLEGIRDMMAPNKGCPTPGDLMATWRQAKDIRPTTPAYSKVKKFTPAMETCRQEALKTLKSEFKDDVIEMRQTLASRLTQDATFQFFGAYGFVSAKAEGKSSDVLKLRYQQFSLSDMRRIAQSDKSEVAQQYFQLLTAAGFRKVIWIDTLGERKCAYTRRVLGRPCTVFHPLKPTPFKKAFERMLEEEGWKDPFVLPEHTPPQIKQRSSPP